MGLNAGFNWDSMDVNRCSIGGSGSGLRRPWLPCNLLAPRFRPIWQPEISSQKQTGSILRVIRDETSGSDCRKSSQRDVNNRADVTEVPRDIAVIKKVTAANRLCGWSSSTLYRLHLYLDLISINAL